MKSCVEKGCSRTVGGACLYYRNHAGIGAAIIYSIVQVALEIAGLTLSIFEFAGRGVYQLAVGSTDLGEMMLKKVPGRLIKCVMLVLTSPFIFLVSLGSSLYNDNETLPLFPLAEKYFWIINSTGKYYS